MSGCGVNKKITGTLTLVLYYLFLEMAMYIVPSVQVQLRLTKLHHHRQLRHPILPRTHCVLQKPNCHLVSSDFQRNFKIPTKQRYVTKTKID